MNTNEFSAAKRAMEYRGLIDVLLSEDRFSGLVLRGGLVINTLTRAD